MKYAVAVKVEGLRLFAQPYDLCASGFYFDTFEEYKAKSAKHVNSYGQPVEEYEIDLIDGKALEIALFEAVKPNQSTLSAFFLAVETWDDDELVRACIVYGDGLNSCQFDGYSPRDDVAEDLEIYENVTFTELAEQFVDDGLLGEIPDHLSYYIDYEAFGRDLSHDGYTKVDVAGTQYIYRAG